MQSRLSNLIKRVGGLAVFLAAIELTLRVLDFPIYLLPKPSDIAIAAMTQMQSIAVAWWVTVSEGLVGLAGAVIVSSSLALSTIFLPRRISEAINTFGVVLQSTPLLAIAPLLSLWFGQSFLAKSAAASIVCFFPLLTGWLAGLRSVDVDRLHLFENLGAGKWQLARYLLVPAALPFFFGGLRIAVPLSILGAIVGEFVGSAEGIGFQILTNSYYVRTPLMFSYVLVAALTGWIGTSITSSLEARVLFWHGSARVR